jgi:hypothetical protein
MAVLEGFHTTTPSERVKFAFRRGSRVKGDPERIAEWLAELYEDQGGELRPAVVVEAARPPESPGHVLFEWDDAIAAHRYRLIQARTIIRSIEVVTVPASQPSGGAIAHEPVYVYVPRGDDGVYRRVDDVITRPDEYAAALAALMAKHDALARSVDALKRRAEASPGYTRRARLLGMALEALEVSRESLQRAAEDESPSKSEATGRGECEHAAQTQTETDET